MKIYVKESYKKLPDGTKGQVVETFFSKPKKFTYIIFTQK
ncbi:hypothetical protein SAMN05216244_1704 [Sediminibacillus halophilus]|uniref:Uncharacterized protein n=1 Tax=Sediminibacillus halophilus TaxID=482461 RepID=A0A1G9QX02_9BACI|nr:hypothetical protein SAMN05216244_1704 [Sediminibacillus halophilus]